MSLDAFRARIEEAMTEKTNVALLMTARLRALQQALQEVCARLGVSEEQFEQRFQAAFEWHYDHLSQKASDAAPSLASQLDTRTVDQIPTDECPPPIFREDGP